MKIARYIFSFYLLLLAVIPCCEFDQCEDEKPVAATGHEEEQEGNCSPFSYCTSCSNATIINEPFQLEMKASILSTSYNCTRATQILDEGNEYWQPPRLV